MIYIYNGKILTADGGKIAVDAACCCGTAVCPSDCTALGNYTGAISSIGGGCAGCDNTYTGRSYTLTKSGCTWSDYTWQFDQYEITIDVTCATALWTCSVYLNCFHDISCFYTATLTGTIAAKANPTGTYNISGGGLTATFTIT